MCSYYVSNCCGAEIEQLDDGTLFSAFKNRVPVTEN